MRAFISLRFFSFKISYIYSRQKGELFLTLESGKGHAWHLKSGRVQIFTSIRSSETARTSAIFSLLATAVLIKFGLKDEYACGQHACKDDSTIASCTCTFWCSILDGINSWRSIINETENTSRADFKRRIEFLLKIVCF